MGERQDLTTGSVAGKLMRFALPLLFANLLQSLYSVVDMLVVGNIVGEAGLAAISNASMISFIINSICIGVTTGGTVMIAQYRGAKDGRAQAEAVGAVFEIALAASVAVTILGLCAHAPVFRALKVPAASMGEACAYMRIICCGTVFAFGYNAVCAVMKGFGDSKRPLCFVAIATVLNIALDLIFVGPLGMGTAGAAWATILSQGASFLAAVVHLKRRNSAFEFDRRCFAPKPDRWRAILKVGLPAAVQMVAVNVAYLLVAGMLNRFGVSVAAASGVGLKINTFAGMPCWAIGQALTAMAGQCMGAGDVGRAREAARTGLRLNLLATLLSVAIVQLFAGPIVALFEPESPEVLRTGVEYLRMCCGVNSLVYATMYTFDSFALGVGSAHVAMIDALLDAAVVRLPVSWLLAFALGAGYAGAYIGQAVSPVLPAVVGLMYFRGGAWEKRAKR